MLSACLLNSLGNIAFWRVLAYSRKGSYMEASKRLRNPVNYIGACGKRMPCDYQRTIASKTCYLVSQAVKTSRSEENVFLWKEKVLALQDVLGRHIMLPSDILRNIICYFPTYHSSSL
jgi:hypothetical protein